MKSCQDVGMETTTILINELEGHIDREDEEAACRIGIALLQIDPIGLEEFEVAIRAFILGAEGISDVEPMILAAMERLPEWDRPMAEHCMFRLYALLDEFEKARTLMPDAPLDDADLVLFLKVYMENGEATKAARTAEICRNALNGSVDEGGREIIRDALEEFDDSSSWR